MITILFQRIDFNFQETISSVSVFWKLTLQVKQIFIIFLYIIFDFYNKIHHHIVLCDKLQFLIKETNTV